MESGGVRVQDPKPRRKTDVSIASECEPLGLEYEIHLSFKETRHETKD